MQSRCDLLPVGVTLSPRVGGSSQTAENPPTAPSNRPASLSEEQASSKALPQSQASAETAYKSSPGMILHPEEVMQQSADSLEVPSGAGSGLVGKPGEVNRVSIAVKGTSPGSEKLSEPEPNHSKDTRLSRESCSPQARQDCKSEQSEGGTAIQPESLRTETDKKQARCTAGTTASNSGSSRLQKRQAAVQKQSVQRATASAKLSAGRNGARGETLTQNSLSQSSSNRQRGSPRRSSQEAGLMEVNPGTEDAGSRRVRQRCSGTASTSQERLSNSAQRMPSHTPTSERPLSKGNRGEVFTKERLVDGAQRKSSDRPPSERSLSKVDRGRASTYSHSLAVKPAEDVLCLPSHQHPGKGAPSSGSVIAQRQPARLSSECQHLNRDPVSPEPQSAHSGTPCLPMECGTPAVFASATGLSKLDEEDLQATDSAKTELRLLIAKAEELRQEMTPVLELHSQLRIRADAGMAACPSVLH